MVDHRSRAPARAAGAGLALVLALLSAGCSGGSGGSGVTLPSITATPSRTGEALPSVTRSPAEPSESRGDDSADEGSTPERSREQSQAPSTPEVSAQESTAVVSTTPSAASASTTTSDDSGWPPWVLVTLVLVAIGVVIAIVAHRRARHRDEHASYETALSESLWFGRDLTPTLLGDSADERRGAWSVARSRVVALEGRLTRLASPGSESTDSSNAQQLATAVVGLRRALDAESQPAGPGPDAAAEALGGVKQAARQLDQVLSGLAPTPAAPG